MVWIIILGIVILLFIVAIGIFLYFRGQKKVDIKVPIQPTDFPVIPTQPVRPIQPTDFPIIPTQPVRPTQPTDFPIRPTQPVRPTQPQVELFPYKVIGASDGTWFQVLDQNNNIVASLNEPIGTPTFEQVCPSGSSVEYVGFSKGQNGTELSSVGCYYPTANTTVFQGDKNNIDTIFSLGKNTKEINGCNLGLPSMFESVGITGYMNTRGIGRVAKGISYICVENIPCTSQSQCPPDTICSGGKCISFDQL